MPWNLTSGSIYHVYPSTVIFTGLSSSLLKRHRTEFASLVFKLEKHQRILLTQSLCLLLVIIYMPEMLRHPKQKEADPFCGAQSQNSAEEWFLLSEYKIWISQIWPSSEAMIMNEWNRSFKISTVPKIPEWQFICETTIGNLFVVFNTDQQDYNTIS